MKKVFEVFCPCVTQADTVPSYAQCLANAPHWHLLTRKWLTPPHDPAWWGTLILSILHTWKLTPREIRWLIQDLRARRHQSCFQSGSSVLFSTARYASCSILHKIDPQSVFAHWWSNAVRDSRYPAGWTSQPFPLTHSLPFKTSKTFFALSSTPHRYLYLLILSLTLLAKNAFDILLKANNTKSGK